MPPNAVRIDTRRGDTLAARLDLPVDRSPVAYALFAHCLGRPDAGEDDAAVGAAGEISAVLARAGIGVLRLDLGAAREEGASGPVAVEDLLDAAEHLRSNHGPVRLLLGHSLGGAAALLAAQELDEVRAVATLAAPHDAEALRGLGGGEADPGGGCVRIGDRWITVDAGLLRALEEGGIEDALRALRRPLLVMHSPVDNVIGIAQARRLFEGSKHPKSYVSLHQADHVLRRVEDARFAGRMVAAWAADYLGRDEAPAWQQRPDDNRTVVRTAGGLRTEAMTNGFGMVLDEPLAAGGTNTGPSPYDLLATALGACTSMTLRLYADRKGWPLAAVMVRVDHRKVHAEDCEGCEDKPRRLDLFERRIRVEGPLDDAQRERLLEIANRCPVHRTLTGQVRVDSRLVESLDDDAA
jgi:putative redox protein